MTEKIIILDFGSQYTQLIARAVREANVYCEIIPFNKPTMFAGDKLWYGIVDAEAFIILDKTVDERFANRYRFRTGIGYRLNYACRFEFMYTLQGSRTEIGQEFDTIDNIFRIRFKYFLNASSTYKLKIFGGGN